MIVQTKTTATVFENSAACNGVSYGSIDGSIDLAVISVDGRYPGVGYLVNEVSDEVVYVLRGEGKLISAEKRIHLQRVMQL